jgi:NTP pyrophosphatase (non-canonical NTP hydrolase)
MDNSRFQRLGERLLAFAEAREWRQFHSPKNLSMALAGEAGELLEHFQWLSEADSTKLSDSKREAVALELADIQIYLIRLGQELDIDVLAAVERKIAINDDRYPADKVRGSHKKYNEY